MDLIAIDDAKARAHEAASRGHREEADAGYEQLLPHFERHAALESVLAIQFNRLLMAIEDEDWEDSALLAADLIQGFEALEDSTAPLVEEVARGVWALFAHPIEPLDRGLVHQLASLAARWISTPIPPWAPIGLGTELFEALDPQSLAHIEALDAARLAVVGAWSLEPSSTTSGLAGLAPLLTAGPARTTLPGVDGHLEDHADALKGADRFRAYQALVHAFLVAVDRDPPQAMEWLVGLRQMEAEGLPDRLAYAPGLPMEHRLRGAIKLHRRVAEAMCRLAGWEDAARVQYREVLRLADLWRTRVKHRTSRGGGRGGDLADEARTAVFAAEALIRLGRPAEALERLAPLLVRASRNALGHPEVAAEVLLAAADVAERMGRADAAQQHYAEAAELSMPGCTRELELSALADRIDELLAEQGHSRLLLSARALAGQARTGAPEASAILNRARHLITLARSELPRWALAEVRLVVELTGACLEQPTGGLRALEAARALGDPQGCALATVHLALTTLSVDDPRARARGLSDLVQAATEARRAASGAVRVAVELAVAVCHLETGDGGDMGRVEVHLRRAAEAGEGSAWPDGAGPWDVYRPRRSGLSAAAVIRAAAGAELPELAWRLAAAERGRRQAARPAHLDAARAEVVRHHHEDILQTLLALDTAPSEEALRIGQADLAAQLSHSAPRPRSPRRPGPHEAWLECAAFDEGIALCLVRSEDTAVRWWPAPAGELAQQVTEVRELVTDADGARPELARICRALHASLLGPFGADLEGIERLIIAPDGALVDLPFPVLYDGTFLSDRFDVIVQRPVTGLFDRPDRTPPPVALLVGDDATAEDLQISTLAREGLYSTVEVRHGHDLTPDALPETIPPSAVVHLIGAVSDGPTLALREGHPPLPVSEVARALAESGVRCVIVKGPVHGPVGAEAIGTLCAAVPVVLARHWAAEGDEAFLLDFLRGAAEATGPWGFARALRRARRQAIRARQPVRTWSGYEMYVSELV